MPPVYPEVVASTPSILSNGCSMHQKQPPAKVATALPGGAAGSFAICARAGNAKNATRTGVHRRKVRKSVESRRVIGILVESGASWRRRGNGWSSRAASPYAGRAIIEERGETSARARPPAGRLARLDRAMSAARTPWATGRAAARLRARAGSERHRPRRRSPRRRPRRTPVREARERRIDAGAGPRAPPRCPSPCRAARGRARGVVAVEGARHPVAEHPARAGARRDDVEHLPQVEAGSAREREGFRAGREVRRGQQVVDDLERRRIARPGPSANRRPAIRSSMARTCAKASASPETIIVIVPAAALAGPPETGASRSAMPCAASRGASAATYAGSTVDETSTMRRRSGRGHAVGAEQHGFDLRRIDHEQHDDLAGAGEIGGRCGGRRAVADGERLRFGPDIARGGRDARADQALHDASAHRAGADDADATPGCGSLEHLRAARSGIRPWGGPAGSWRRLLRRLYGWQSASGIAAPWRTSCRSVPLPRNSMSLLA